MDKHGVIAIIPCDVMERLPEMRRIPYEPTPGMEPFPCPVCGVKGWLGPKQKAAKATHPEVPILCMNCVVKVAQEAKARGEPVFGSVKHMDEIS